MGVLTIVNHVAIANKNNGTYYKFINHKWSFINFTFDRLLAWPGKYRSIKWVGTPPTTTTTNFWLIEMGTNNTRCHKSFYDVSTIQLMAPRYCWRNTLPFFGAVALCTTKIGNSRRRPSWSLWTLVLLIFKIPNSCAEATIKAACQVDCKGPIQEPMYHLRDH